MNKKKYKFIFIIFIVIFLLLATSSAFVVRSIKADNILTFGNLKMEIIQTQVKDGIEKKVSGNEKLEIADNLSISRIVKVKNIGKHPMFVRILLNVYTLSDNGEKIDINNLVSYDINTNDWLYEDGWYYYKHALLQGETTNPLIKNITFNTDIISNKLNVNKFNFDINAYALQSENNSKNVLDAKGWPSK